MTKASEMHFTSSKGPCIGKKERNEQLTKSCIRETLNLSTVADSSNDTIDSKKQKLQHEMHTNKHVEVNTKVISLKEHTSTFGNSSRSTSPMKTVNVKKSVSINEFSKKAIEEFNNSNDIMILQCSKCGKQFQE